MRQAWMCLASCVLLATAAAGQEYFVATDGTDANPGTLEKPFKDPIKAAAKLMPGDTLFFRAGEYKCAASGTYGLAPARSGEEGKPITFKNYKDEHVKIDCAGSDWGFCPNGWSWIVIDGFDITNKDGYAIKISANSGNGKQTGSHVTVRNCEVHHTGNEAIFAFETPYLTIENVFTHDAQRSHGVYINKGCHNVVLRNITSLNNRGNSGTQINASGGGTKDALVERCILGGCAQGYSLMGVINGTFRHNLVLNDGYDGHERGSGWREVILWNGNELGGKGTACEGVLFENNTLVNTVPDGHKMGQIFQIKPTTKNITFRNNIIVIRGKDLFNMGAFEGFVFENNCLFNIGGGQQVAGAGRLVDFCKKNQLKESGTVEKDPMFVDIEKGDLHLKDGSPCLGAGVAKDGKPRDIGAWQRGDDFQLGAKLPWKKDEAK
jgi:hypothetical protein